MIFFEFQLTAFITDKYLSSLAQNLGRKPLIY